MKTKFTLLKRAMAMLSLVVATVSCSQEGELESVTPNETREPITFNVTNDTATRGAIATSISSFKVYAVDSETNSVVINNATFTKVDGVWSTDATFYWSGNEITFCAYVPSDNFTQSGTTLKFSMDADVEDQEDLMVAKDVKSTGSVSFSFERIMSLVKFSVKGEDEDAYVVESVTMSGVADAASFDMATGEWGPVSTSGASFAADVVDSGSEGQITTSTGYLMVLPQTSDITITAVNSNGTPKEYELTDEEWVAGNLYNYTIDRDGIEPEVEEDPSNDDENVKAAGSEYDLTDEVSANCYMLKPSSSVAVEYYIPVEERINTFWGGGSYEDVPANCISATTKWTPEILWGDVSTTTGLTIERVTSSEFDGGGANVNSALKVTLPQDASYSGNVVVGIKNEDGTTLWSWHLWITDYYPYVSISNTNYYIYQVPTGGYVHRLEEGTFTFYGITANSVLWDGSNGLYGSTDYYMMDRNVGATDNTSSGYGTDLSGKGSIYYQFGRKDPFPADATLVGNTQPSVKSTYYTMANTVNNPTVFVSGSSDYWISDSSKKYTKDNYFWNDPEMDSYKTGSISNGYTTCTYYIEPEDGKSIFDPSPLGWKIPNWLTWAYFDDNYTDIYRYTNGCRYFYDQATVPMYYTNGYINGSNGSITDAGSYGKACAWSNMSVIDGSAYSGIGMLYQYKSTLESTQLYKHRHGLPVRPIRFMQEYDL